MKAIYLLISFLFAFVYSNAQQNSASQNSVDSSSDTSPEFPAGDQALTAFLQKNIVYPQDERDKGVEGKIIVRLLVDTDGSTHDAEIMKSLSPGLDKEAIRAVNLLPKLKPAYHSGKPVKVYLNLPIVFKLTEPVISEEEKLLLAKIKKDENFKNAAILADAGFFKDALNQVKKSIDTFPNEYLSYTLMAQCEAQIGECQEACQHIMKAKKLGLPDADIFVNRICD